jgi:UDP-N-acetylglucosamine 2-epimerase (non-hydrolysing)
MKIFVLIGTRPEAIKLCPLIIELQKKAKVFVCLSGQHMELVNEVLAEFDIVSDKNLEIMKQGQDLFHITTSVIDRLKDVLSQNNPDYVVVQGDTTTAFSGALAAFYCKIPVVHVEAGLRTFDIYNPFPEEINRQLISKIASFNFPPTPSAFANLINENVPNNKIYLVGNTVVDALNYIKRKYGINEKSENKILVTAHRRENQGENLLKICDLIIKLSINNPTWSFVWPMHPNPNFKEIILNKLSGVQGVKLIEPLSYSKMINEIVTSKIIITDSGGIQEEAVAAGIPVFVSRISTERPEGIEAGVAQLLSFDLDKDFSTIQKSIKNEIWNNIESNNCYGDGNASVKITNILLNLLNNL